MMIQNKLILSYANSQHTDGGAAQLQRKVAIFCLARSISCNYLDSEIIKIDFPGVNNLEKHSPQIQAWNEMYQFPSTENPRFANYIEIPILENEIWEWIISLNSYARIIRTYIQLSILKKKSRSDFTKVDGELKLSITRTLLGFKKIVLKLSNVYPAVESDVDMIYSFAKEIKLRFQSIDTDPEIRVAVHVRRGDLLVREKSRILSDKYFNNLLKFLIRLENESHTKTRITIYTDCPKSRVEMVAKDHATWRWSHSDNELIEIDPLMYSWEYLNGLCDVGISIQDDPDSFKALHKADILIASKSSYSYLPAIFSDSKVLMPVFWHKGTNDWLILSSEEVEAFDLPVQTKLRDYLLPIFRQS